MPPPFSIKSTHLRNLLKVVGMAVALAGLTYFFISVPVWLTTGFVLIGATAIISHHYLPQKKPFHSPDDASLLPLLEPANPSTGNLPPKTLVSVLLVEDNPLALKLLSKLVITLGAREITETRSAEEALELLATRSFSLILTDYRLSGISGVQLLETIRKRGDQTPVIVLSATPDQTGVLRTASFKHTDFFGKPLRKQELVAAIDRLGNH